MVLIEMKLLYIYIYIYIFPIKKPSKFVMQISKFIKDNITQFK